MGATRVDQPRTDCTAPGRIRRIPLVRGAYGSQAQEQPRCGSRKRSHNHYPRLYLMAALSFVAMFILMDAVVDRFENVYVKLKQVC